jgi:hypothetical protein
MFAEDFSPVVQWIECQIPVLMMGVRIPSGEQRKAFRKRGFFCIRRDENRRAGRGSNALLAALRAGKARRQQSLRVNKNKPF